MDPNDINENINETLSEIIDEVIDQNNDNNGNLEYPLNIMDIKHPKINDERTIMNLDGWHSLYVKRENIEICIMAHRMKNNYLHIDRSIISEDEFDNFIDHLNSNSRITIWIYEGFVEHHENHCGHSYTRVICDYEPSCNCYLYFKVQKMEPFYTHIR